MAGGELGERRRRLAQRVRPADHGLDPAGLDELRQRQQALLLLLDRDAVDAPADDQRQQRGLDDDDAGGAEPALPEPAAVGDQRAARLGHANAPGQGVPEHVVEHQVVPFRPFGEVVTRVIDEVVGADPTDQVELLSAAHPGHLGAHRLGDLHGEAADPAAGAGDQHPLPGADAGDVAQRPERGEAGHRHGRGLLEREARGLGSQVLGRGDRVLREGARARPDVAGDLVAGAQVRHARAHGLDHAGEVGAAHAGSRPAEAEGGTDDVGHAGEAGDVGRVHRRGADPHEHLAVAGDGPLDLVQPQDPGRAVDVVDDGPHDLLRSDGGGLLMRVAAQRVDVGGHGGVLALVVIPRASLDGAQDLLDGRGARTQLGDVGGDALLRVEGGLGQQFVAGDELPQPYSTTAMKINPESRARESGLRGVQSTHGPNVGRRCAMTLRSVLARRWVAATVIVVLAAVTFAVPAWCVASGTWGW